MIKKNKTEKNCREEKINNWMQFCRRCQLFCAAAAVVSTPVTNEPRNGQSVNLTNMRGGCRIITWGCKMCVWGTFLLLCVLILNFQPAQLLLHSQIVRFIGRYMYFVQCVLFGFTRTKIKYNDKCILVLIKIMWPIKFNDIKQSSSLSIIILNCNILTICLVFYWKPQFYLISYSC